MNFRFIEITMQNLITISPVIPKIWKFKFSFLYSKILYNENSKK